MDSQMNSFEIEKPGGLENSLDDKTKPGGLENSLDNKTIKQLDFEKHMSQGDESQNMDSSINGSLQNIELPSDVELYSDLPQDFILSDKDISAIKWIASAPRNQKLVHIDDAFVYQRHMTCLLQEVFLLGEVMSAYINCIRSQPSMQNRDGGIAFLEDTYISGIFKIQGDVDADDNVASWLVDRAQTYLQHDMVFLPINIKDSHWYLAVINAPQQQIQILDSYCWTDQRSDLKQTLAGLESVLKILAQRKNVISHKWKDQKVSSWKIYEHLQSPPQSDGVSCGLFLLKFMEKWAGTELSQSISQEEMKKFRLKLAAVLVYWKTNKARTTLEFENVNDTGTEGVEYLGTRPAKRKNTGDSPSEADYLGTRLAKRKNTGDSPSEADRYASLLHVLSTTGKKQLISCLCSYIMSIGDDDNETLGREWVRSSMPYSISLTLRQIKSLLNGDLGMDIDCFNMGVRMLVSEELKLLKRGEKIFKHYMDMFFCTMGQFTKGDGYRPKLDAQRLAKCFGGWPGLPYDTSSRKMMLMMPIVVGGRYTLYVFDETNRVVFIMDPKHYDDKTIDEECLMKIHMLKLRRMEPTIRLARRVGCPRWSEDIFFWMEATCCSKCSKG